MKKYFIFILSVVIIIIFLAVRFNPNDNPFEDLKVENVESLKISTQVTENPEQKILSEKDEISKVIEFLKNIKCHELKKRNEHKGWTFSISFNDVGISFMGCYMDVNGTTYKIKNSMSNEFTELYDKIDVEPEKFP